MGLTSKIIAPLLIIGSIIIPCRSFSQEIGDASKTQQEKFTPKTYISGGIGWYWDNNENFKERYESIFGFKIKAMHDFNKHFRGEAGVAIFTKEKEGYVSYGPAQRPGDPPLAVVPDRSLSIIHITGAAHYYSYWSKDLISYTKAGFIFTQAREQVGDDKASGQGLGLTVGPGLEFNLDNEYKAYLELLYRSVSTERLDLSGYELSLGIRRTLK